MFRCKGKQSMSVRKPPAELRPFGSSISKDKQKRIQCVFFWSVLQRSNSVRLLRRNIRQPPEEIQARQVRDEGTRR